MRIALFLFLVATVVSNASFAQAKLPEGFALVKKEGVIAIYERWIIFPD